MSNMLLSTIFAVLSCYISTTEAAAAAAATTTASSSFPVITDTENTGALDGGASSQQNQPVPGAEGADSGLNLSNGAIAGIAIAIAIIIIAFGKPVSLWWLQQTKLCAIVLTYVSHTLGSLVYSQTPQLGSPRYLQVRFSQIDGTWSRAAYPKNSTHTASCWPGVPWCAS